MHEFDFGFVLWVRNTVIGSLPFSAPLFLSLNSHMIQQSRSGKIVVRFHMHASTGYDRTTVSCLQVSRMVQFSMAFAAAQNDADKRIILENEKLIHSEDEPPESRVSATLLKEWWRKCFPTGLHSLVYSFSMVW
jgi:hypothetical protein